jgi:hypothetical protein
MIVIKIDNVITFKKGSKRRYPKKRKKDRKPKKKMFPICSDELNYLNYSSPLLSAPDAKAMIPVTIVKMTITIKGIHGSISCSSVIDLYFLYFLKLRILYLIFNRLVKIL